MHASHFTLSKLLCRNFGALGAQTSYKCASRRVHMENNNRSDTRGALIVLEGLDRSGKTSQSVRLVSYLNGLGYPVESWRFPDRDTAVGKMISSYLSNQSQLDDHTIHLLFSANRWEKRSLMEAKLKSGTSLIVDRYSYSGVAFSSAKGLDIEWCKAPEVGLLAPDLVVYLDIPPEKAAERGGYGGERYEKLEFQKNVAQYYKKLSDASWKIIDACQPMEDVEKQLKEIVLDCVKSCQNGQMGFNPNTSGSQEEPGLDSMLETQPERQPESSSRGKRSYKKKDSSMTCTQMVYQPWTKDEEYALAQAWLDISEDPDVANYQSSSLFWTRFWDTFFKVMGRGEYRENDSISSKWTDINGRCHAFQEVYQRVANNWGNDYSDTDILKRTLKEYNTTRGTFAYMRCWELLKGSLKWTNVPGMTSTSRRKAKRLKISYSVDPDTPTSDARSVNLNEDVVELEKELLRSPGRRSIRQGGRGESSSGGGDIKEKFEEMNRLLQDIHDFGARRLDIMRERIVENKKFVAIQEARQMEKDIEFMSKSIDHLTGDALLLAQMRRQQIRDKYGL